MPRADDSRCVTVVAHDIGPFGGMEAQLTALIEGLLERDIEVRAIGRRIELAPHESLTTYEVPGPSRPFPLAYVWFFIAGSIAVARVRRGALYTMGAIVFNRSDAAKVPFCHAAWASDPDRPSRAAGSGPARRISAALSAFLSRTAERIVYRPGRCGALVAMSRAGADELNRFFPAMRPARVIPNGVDTERFQFDRSARNKLRQEIGFDENELVAIFLGGDWHRKGLPQTISAIGKQSAWSLMIAGRGDAESMTDHVIRSNAVGQVAFVGRVSRPERYLAAADALVMPSDYEPFGNAVLESSSVGLPVVVAPAHGVLDFVEPGRSGIFVQPEADEIAAALAALKDPELRRSMGGRGREIAAEYSFDNVADRYVELLLGSARAAVTPSISQISAETA